PPAFPRPHLRLHDGDRFDARVVARGECHREFRQGRAAPASAHRSARLRPGRDAAVRRPVGHALRPRERAADRPGRGEDAAAVPHRVGSRPTAHLMTTAAVAVPLTRRSVSPWVVAVAVVIPTFMEVLDTTIANVALRYIAGGLSSPVTDSEWVITSYLAANAIILPISGWLAMQLG